MVVVIVNNDKERTITFNGIDGRDSLKLYTTDSKRSLELTYDGDYRQTVTVPAYSITTAIFE